jgi:triphosphoribosyl-dephospho-CoA synthase
MAATTYTVPGGADAIAFTGAKTLNGAIADAYRDACAVELRALKPGNVHQYADGHGMTVADFLKSAQASAGPIAAPGLGLGERVYRAVEATRAEVGCNTNLGIVLLCAPLAQALLDGKATGSLRERLRQVLRKADREDSEWLFRAIRLAAPAGLGESGRHDVGAPADAPLAQVMAYAARRDRIARQYATDYADLFQDAVPRLRGFAARWGDEAWAAAALFQDLLSRLPDTHVARKLGAKKARAVSRRVVPLARALARSRRPDDLRGPLLRLDRELKGEGINPGTSADLTVASLLILRLEPLGSGRELAARHRRIPVPGAAECGPGLHL